MFFWSSKKADDTCILVFHMPGRWRTYFTSSYDSHMERPKLPSMRFWIHLVNTPPGGILTKRLRYRVQRCDLLSIRPSSEKVNNGPHWLERIGDKIIKSHPTFLKITTAQVPKPMVRDILVTIRQNILATAQVQVPEPMVIDILLTIRWHIFSNSLQLYS